MIRGDVDYDLGRQIPERLGFGHLTMSPLFRMLYYTVWGNLIPAIIDTMELAQKNNGAAREQER